MRLSLRLSRSGGEITSTPGDPGQAVAHPPTDGRDEAPLVGERSSQARGHGPKTASQRVPSSAHTRRDAHNNNSPINATPAPVSNNRMRYTHRSSGAFVPIGEGHRPRLGRSLGPPPAAGRRPAPRLRDPGGKCSEGSSSGSDRTGQRLTERHPRCLRIGRPEARRPGTTGPRASPARPSRERSSPGWMGISTPRSQSLTCGLGNPDLAGELPPGTGRAYGGKLSSISPKVGTGGRTLGSALTHQSVEYDPRGGLGVQPLL